MLGQDKGPVGCSSASVSSPFFLGVGGRRADGKGWCKWICNLTNHILKEICGRYSSWAYERIYKWGLSLCRNMKVELQKIKYPTCTEMVLHALWNYDVDMIWCIYDMSLFTDNTQSHPVNLTMLQWFQDFHCCFGKVTVPWKTVTSSIAHFYRRIERQRDRAQALRSSYLIFIIWQRTFASRWALADEGRFRVSVTVCETFFSNQMIPT